MSIFKFSVTAMDGSIVSLDEYKGKVILIVNTASKCGFTPQFEALEKLYQQYKDRDFVIIGFPCTQFGNQDPGTNEEIMNFCSLTYGVDFPMMAKIEVNGDNADPLFSFLVKEKGFKGFDMNHPKGKFLHDHLMKIDENYSKTDSIKWNFTKFLVDQQGNVKERYESMIDPEILSADIEKLL